LESGKGDIALTSSPATTDTRNRSGKYEKQILTGQAWTMACGTCKMASVNTSCLPKKKLIGTSSLWVEKNFKGTLKIEGTI
jgi:hypothetical protein